MTQPEAHVGDRLRQLINGYQVTQAIYVAVTLGVPDLLAGGPRSVEDLAQATETHPGSLYRLLRALTAVGIVRETHDEDRRSFELTEHGQLLRSDVPGSLAGWAAFVARPYHWDSWGDLLHTVRTGEAAFAAHHGGESVWAWREQHPEESQIFDRAMSAVAGNRRRASGRYLRLHAVLVDCRPRRRRRHVARYRSVSILRECRACCSTCPM